MAQRHGGIVTFAVLGLLFGIVGTLYNGFVLLMLVFLKQMSGQMEPAASEALNAVNVPMLLSLAVNTLTSVMVFVAGIGLFATKAWARTWYLVAAVITILNRLAMFPLHFTQPPGAAAADPTMQAAQQMGGMVGDLSALVFNGLVLWFLNRSTIKALFKPPATPAP